MAEFEFVGRGHDHIVRRSPYNPHRLLKKPRFLNNLNLFLTGMGAGDIKQELDYAEKVVENSPIRIPKTRVIKRGFGYLMIQDEVIEDKSISDIGEIINAAGIQLIIDKFWEDPVNFKVSGGNVFWIDPTRGSISRTITRLHLMPYEKWVRLRVSLEKLWKNH
jgi:hypothetical protein